MGNIEIYLQEFGLNENESNLYLSLLRLGPSSILDLSKSTKLNRTTVHMNIESLIQKGMATQLMHGARRQIIAEPPEKLKLLIEMDRMKLQKKESELSSLISFVYDTIGNVRENTGSEVKYYEGKELVSKVYDDILTHNQIRTYVNSGNITKVFPENIKKFGNALIRGSEIWDLMEFSYPAKTFMTEYTHLPNFHWKFFPKSISIEALDYLIYGDSIAMIQSEGKVFAIVIKNKLLSKNAKTLYDLMWGLLP